MSSEITELAQKVAELYPGLFLHQTAGVAFLASRRRAVLADEMGLGKTRTAIVAARELAGPQERFLVVCPASLRTNWAREVHMVEPDAAVSHDPESPARWTVLTYDQLRRDKSLVDLDAFAGLIVDEAHYIKNSSARSAAVLDAAGRLRRRDGLVFLLTGTPMANRPRDLFNLLKAIDHPLGRNFYTFAVRYCDGHNNGYGLSSDGASNLDELAAVTSGVMLRRVKDDVLDLPEKLRSWIPVDLPLDKTRKLEQAALEFLRGNPSRQGPSWVRFLALLNKARHQLAVDKVKPGVEFVRACVDSGQKVVVFTSYKKVVDGYVKAFGDECVTLTGDSSPQERDEAVDAFQTREDVRVFVGNLQAAGVGITLTAGTHVVFNDLDWVPANHWQAEDRVHRIGQSRSTFATYLYVQETLDEFVAALLDAKTQAIGTLEAAAAANATLVEAVVSSALAGERLDLPSLGGAPAVSSSSGGVLLDAVRLLEEHASWLQKLDEEETHEFASSSQPGVVYTVRVSAGVTTCDCPGFMYRSTCSHARKVLS